MRDWRGEIRARLSKARLGSAQEADIVEELGQHLDDRFNELVTHGMTALDAERAVLNELNGAVPLEQSLRELGRSAPTVELGSGRSGLHGWWQDVRFALRSFRLNTGFTTAAVLTLGLGAGAATAVFSLLDGVVLRPLPYAAPDRLVTIWETNQKKNLAHERLSPVNSLDYRELHHVFQDVAMWWRPEINLADETGEPMRVSTVETTENLFAVLGVRARLGRTFPIDATLWGKESEAVISNRLWQTRFGGANSVLGRTVKLNGFPYTIVGVMPAGFNFPDDTDVWQRLQWQLNLHSRAAHFMGSVARLADGVNTDAANRELNALGARLAREYPATNDGWSVRAVPLTTDVAGVFKPGLYALFGASGLLLLIACINVANLLLSRAAARQNEIAIRAALGASRLRLLRQLLLESGVLAAFGTVVGFLFAITAVRAFLAWTPIEIPRADQVHVNGTVLAFTAGVTVLTTLIFGFAPALFASGINLQSTLKDTSRGATGRAAGYARKVLVIAQVALAVALLCGAGLLIRTVSALMQENVGVAATGVMTVDVQLPDADYREWPKVVEFYSRLLPALRARPEIAAVGATNVLPLDPGWRMPFELEGAAPVKPEERPMAQHHTIEESYFPTLGVRLLRGRNFSERDRADAPAVVIVNETLARQAWPNEDPIGKRIALPRNVGPLGQRIVASDVHEVVGVVADIKNTSLKSAAEPAIFYTNRQFPFKRMNLMIRSRLDAGALLPLLHSEVRRLDPTIGLGSLRPLERVLAQASDPPRFVMLLMSIFAALALALAGIGIYGTLSYGVSQRTRELGVRLALGARPGDVLQTVAAEGLMLGVVGAVLGASTALFAGRYLATLLYGVRPADPTTILGVSGLVLLVAVSASVAPARKAAAVDPLSTLRS